jgi:HK97 family phage prohead protease
MIHATWPGSPVVAGADEQGGRTITGTAVPWDVPGLVSDGRTVIFHAGSLDAGRRPVALRDHDRTRPIGVVAAADDDGRTLTAAVKVSRFPAGDEALILAADGALPAFSVGAEPTEWTYDDAGTLHVHAADWQELSLLTIGAYPDARVTGVTAGGTMTMTEPALSDAPDEPDTPPPDDDDDETPDAPPVEASARLVTVQAARTRGGTHPFATVGLRQMSGIIHAAAMGDPAAARLMRQIQASPNARLASTVEAALTNVTLVGADNVNALQRPGYQAELIDIVTRGAPVVEALRQGDLQRGDYPNKTFNKWTKTPQVALQSAEKTAINTTAVAITPANVPVQTWATGNDISQQLLDFGAPSFVEDYVRAAAVDYAETIDTYAVTALLAAATAVTTLAGDSFIQVMTKLLTALVPTSVPDGQMFLAVSWDVGIGIAGITDSGRPAFWDGSISFGSYMPTATVGGLSIIVDVNLPAKTYLLGVRGGATWYDLPGVPYTLKAVNVGLLGLDVGVFGYGALGVQYPAAFVKTTQP